MDNQENQFEEYEKHLKLTGRTIPKYEPQTPEEKAKLKLDLYKKQKRQEYGE